MFLSYKELRRNKTNRIGNYMNIFNHKLKNKSTEIQKIKKREKNNRKREKRRELKLKK